MTTDASTSHLSNVWFQVTGLDVASGDGSWVTTVDGTRYLDFTGGIAVTSTGHSHPAVVDAISRQATRFIHAQANCYRHDLLEPLATALNEITPPSIDTFFYANSGAEITEAAIKLAKQATGRPNTIVFNGSFHGRTHQTMAMTTSKTVYRAGHAPLPGGVHIAPFPAPYTPDPNAAIDDAVAGFEQLLATVTAPSETAAAILEPVLGEGGYHQAPPAFVQRVADICRTHGILFIADEVQSGFGRTGKMFAIDHTGVEPDIICMAKGIASGFPFAALGTRRELDDLWPTGSHGGTYGGNPIGCAAALATIDIITSDGFLDNVNERGAQLLAGLRELAQAFPQLTNVRGVGMMIACELNTAEVNTAVREHCLSKGRLLLMSAGTAGTTLRWMPPLTVTADEIDQALVAFGAALGSL